MPCGAVPAGRGGGPGGRGAPWNTGEWLGVDRRTDGWTGPVVDMSGGARGPAEEAAGCGLQGLGVEMR